MKPKIVLLIFNLLFSSILVGQTHYGLKAGVNISNQQKKINPPGYSSEKIETKLLPGFQLGAFLKHELNQKFSLATELNFSTLGSKTEYTRTDFVINPDGTISGESSGYYNDKIQQIEIPVFFQYNVKKFYFGLGPTIGIKISSKIDNYQNTSFNSKHYNTFDFGVSPIIGYSIQKKVDLTLKYNYGLTNADNRDYSTINNRVANFSVLYTL